MSRLPVALCQFGLSWSTGHTASADGRTIDAPLTPSRFLALAVELGLAGVEVAPSFAAQHPGGRRGFAGEASDLGLTVIAAGPTIDQIAATGFVDAAGELGATTLRCIVSRVLCGRRATIGGPTGWRALLDAAAEILRRLAPILEHRGLRLGVENHQDAGSADLLELVERVGSPAVGVTMDTGNPLAVGEPIEAFAEAVDAALVHAHLKDYRVLHRTDGFCLARCPLGDGVVPFAELLAHWRGRPGFLPSLELAALVGREIPVLDAGWWADLGDRELAAVLPVFALWHIAGEADDGFTPYETGEVDRLADWEIDQVRRSVAYLREILP